MELIHDSLKNAYAFLIQHPIEALGGIVFIVFVVRLTKKEADKNLINKLLSDLGMAFVYTSTFWYYIPSKIGHTSRTILYLLTCMLCYNVSAWEPSLISKLSAIDPDLGSVPAPQITMSILLLMVLVTLIGYFFDAPIDRRDFEKLHLEREQRNKAMDLSAPDKWSR